ncbi:MAG TPA: hypothetical protein VNG71_10215 [Pyrinomonadaceae bacterium]|nr:hypothetical protein [Pyrinomonadaceae bacterium]
MPGPRRPIQTKIIVVLILLESATPLFCALRDSTQSIYHVFMNFKQTILIVVSALALGLGCANRSAGQNTSQKPAKLTTPDLQKLRWIEGTWRGTGDVDKPFFERYRFEKDSTLAVDSFADATLAKVTDTTRFELKDGEFGGGSEGSRWVAVSLDDRGIEFGPAANVRNSFRWEQESKDIWKRPSCFLRTAISPPDNSFLRWSAGRLLAKT